MLTKKQIYDRIPIEIINFWKTLPGTLECSIAMGDFQITLNGQSWLTDRLLCAGELEDKFYLAYWWFGQIYKEKDFIKIIKMKAFV